MSEDLSKLLVKAKLAEQAERYEDMAKIMKQYVETSTAPLTTEERNLLSVAYKNAVGSRRSAWRMISTYEQKPEENDIKAQLAREYRMKIEEELKEVCEEVLQLIKNALKRVPEGYEEDEVFLLKMLGDYHRYESEVCKGNDTSDNNPVNVSQQSYEDAMAVAKRSLPPTHPIRLGLALNYSVFYYEIKNDSTAACNIARQAFDEAIAELDTLAEDSYKDSTLIMQLLRDNLALWSESQNADVEAETENQ